MAGIPKVKIQFDADTDGLKKGSKDAEHQVDGFAGKVQEFGKKAAAAFAVAAAAAVAYAGKLAIDGVKAAIEDEQAQLRLASALQAATGATNDQIKAVEDQITKTSLATGVADDKLRPALQRLSVATGDVQKSQKLLNLALDVSQATGKPLQSVVDALGKAYEGNTTSLGRLQVGISQAEAKTIDFESAVGKLTNLYGGAADRNAQTFQGRIDRIKVAFDETKESIGQALLPILEKLLGFVTETILPNFQKFSDALQGKGDSILSGFTAVAKYAKDFVEPIFNAVRDAFNKIAAAIKDQLPRFQSIVDTLKAIWEWGNTYIIPLFKTYLIAQIESFGSAVSLAIKVISPLLEAVLKTITTVINGIVEVINLAIKAYNVANNIKPGSKDLPLISKIGATGTTDSGIVNGVQLPFGGASVGGGTTGGTRTGGGQTGGGTTGGGLTGGTGLGSGDGTGTSSKPAKVDVTKESAKDIGEFFANSFLDQISGFDVAGARFFEETGGQLRVPVTTAFDVAAARRGEERSIINLTVNGAMDSEAVARQMVTLLNDAEARGTIGGGGIRGVSAVAL